MGIAHLYDLAELHEITILFVVWGVLDLTICMHYRIIVRTGVGIEIIILTLLRAYSVDSRVRFK